MTKTQDLLRSITFALMGSLILIGTATHLTAIAAPEVDRDVLASKILGEDRTLYIVLPANYSPDNTYPVVYALDGGSRYTPDMAERMQAAHAQLIVVGVENVDRNRDMFPDPLSARGNRGGGGARFLEFLTTELIPYVENKFATNGYRIMSGQSNSAFFVLYAMLNAPDVFDAYLAISPMIGWDWNMIRTDSVGLLEDRQSFPKALFMNQGETDLDQVTEYLPGFVELLREIAPADFRWKSEVVKGSDHVPENSYTNGIAFIFNGR